MTTRRRTPGLDRNGNVDLVGAITRRHLPKIVGGVALGLAAAAAGLAQPAVIGGLIGALGTDADLALPVALIVGLFVAEAALTATQAYAMGRTGERIVYDTRTTLVDRVLSADVGAFAALRQGDVFARVVTDTALLKVALSQSLAGIMVDGAMVIGGIVLMLLIDPVLLGVTAACLVVASLVALLLARRLRRAAQHSRTLIGDFGADLQRALAASTTVKACRAEHVESARLGGLALRARRAGARVSALNALLTPSMSIGVQASLAAVLVTGMSRVAHGAMDVADLTAFIMYLFYLVTPLVTLFMGIGQLQQGRAALGRINELAAVEQEPDTLTAEPDPDPAVLPAAAPAGHPGTPSTDRVADPVPGTGEFGGSEVSFDGVSFSYGAEPVLRDVSFTAPARGLTAIVGPSGAGKTTLLQLLMRFHPVHAGGVRLDGTDIGGIPLGQLRRRIGYVQQESTMLRGTIGENLTYGRSEAPTAEIERALSLAGLDDLVRTLPRGLGTELGDSGIGLSGGQRQRLAIARMLIRRPSVLLLDEATSNLDSDSELDLRTSIRDIAAECTVLSVAHRMSTVVGADRIVVLDQGAVDGIGTHHELSGNNRLYQRLATIQFQDGGPDAVPAGQEGR